MNSTTIRGHHLESLREVAGLSREELADKLVSTGYVATPSDPFVDESIRWRDSLLGSPDMLVTVIAGEADEVCYACPLAPKCFLVNPKDSVFYESVFFRDVLSGREKDASAAERHGFQVGESYSMREVRRRLGI